MSEITWTATRTIERPSGTDVWTTEPMTGEQVQKFVRSLVKRGFVNPTGGDYTMIVTEWAGGPCRVWHRWTFDRVAPAA